jgi:Protein of unknown function (DUF3237)
LTTDHESLHQLSAEVPLSAFSLPLLWQAVVEIGERAAVGNSPAGERQIIPITGGFFCGGPGFESPSGTIVPAGADRQLMDEMKTSTNELNSNYSNTIFRALTIAAQCFICC